MMAGTRIIAALQRSRLGRTAPPRGPSLRWGGARLGSCLHAAAPEARSDRAAPHAPPTRRRAPWPSHPLHSFSRDHSPADRRSPPRRGACLSGFRFLLLGCRGFERGGEKLFAGNQRGNEERPGQETERARSLVRSLRPGFEDLPLLFDQFAFFYFVHDRRLHSVPLKNSRPAAFTVC